MSRPIRVFTPGSSAPCAALLAALAAVAVSPAVRGQCQYEITAVIQGPECGIFGFPPIVGTALSDSGEVVGWYTACTIGTDEAFYWSAETGFVTLDRPPGVYAAKADELSEERTIVGTYSVTDIGLRGFIHHLNSGEWTEIEPLEGGAWTWAHAISPDGATVVGARTGGLGGGLTAPYQAYYYDVASSTYTDLGVMSGPSSKGYDIALSDTQVTVVGFTGTDFVSLNARAFVHSTGQTTVLAPIPGGLSSYGRDVNTAGTMLGGGRIEVKDGLILHRAFTYAKGAMELLPLLPGHNDSRPGDIDEFERTVGLSRAFSQPNDWRACLWQDGTVHDLNDLTKTDLPMILEGANSINSTGQILCNGELNGESVVVILTPHSLATADLNDDCNVGAPDLMLLLEQWGGVDKTADLNGDGKVGPADLAMLLSQWG